MGISIAPSLGTGPLDGRMLLLIAADDRVEPRFQVSDSNRTAQVFGVDAEGLRPGQELFVDAATHGYVRVLVNALLVTLVLAAVSAVYALGDRRLRREP